MGDRVAEYLISLGGDASDLTSLFAGIKSRMRSDVAELQAITNKVDLFSAITDNLPKVSAAVDSAKAKVASLTAEIAKIEAAGGKAPKELTAALAQAERAAAAATREFARQNTELNSLRSTLERAGVNTNALAAEQVRLEAATRAAADAAAVAAAKQALGLKTLSDTVPEAQRLRAAFDTLKASGTLSAAEISAAQVRLSASLKEVNDSVTKTGGSFSRMKADARDALLPLTLQATAVIGTLGSLAATLNSVTAAAKAYRQAIAEASAGSDLSKAQIAGLSRQVQQLASDLGEDTSSAIRGVFTLLRSGVPEGNVIEVLRTAAEAAKASLSDLPSGVRVAKLLLQDFKVAPEELGHAFDVLKVSVAGSKDGFEAFSAGAGPLLAVARASNVSLDELTATLRVLQKGGIDAEQSMSDLTKILVALGKPEARQALHQIGIDSTSLVEIFGKLKGAKLQDVIDLSGVSAKSAAAIAALINNADQLNAAFARNVNAAGAVERANAKLYDTPREISERFHATLDVTKQKLGDIVGTSGSATVTITALLGRLNLILEWSAAFNQKQNEGEIAFNRYVLGLLGVGKAAETSAKAQEDYAKKEEAAAQAAERLNASLESQRQKLETNAAALLKHAQQLQAAVEQELAAVEASAQRQVAAIELAAAARDRAVITAKEAVAAILAIQQKAAEDELAIISAKEKQIDALTETAIAARRKLAEGNPVAQQKLADEELAIRRQAAGQQIALYERLYDTLYKQARAQQDRTNALDLERRNFNEEIANRLRAIQEEGLTGTAKYVATVNDVEESLAKAREARAKGNIEDEKRYTAEALSRTDQIKQAATDEGVIVVSAFEAQQKRIELVKKISGEYNDSLKAQGDAASAGAQKAQDELGKIQPILDSLRAKMDGLRAAGEQAIQVRIADEIQGIDKARAAIDDLVRTRTVQIQVSGPSGGGGTAPEVGTPFSGGGPVQRFAGGGHVFNRPTWSKVPGVGDSDSVPALLQEGSFVVRKAASQRAGDALMYALATGYAGGGPVTDRKEQDAVFAYAKYIARFLNHPFFGPARAELESLLLLAMKGQANGSTYQKILAQAQDIARQYPLAQFYGMTSTGAGGTPSRKALLDWETFAQEYGLARGYANGGSVGGDTVPAMLTPGEFVLTPPAVRNIAKLYGGGFLPALNEMRIALPPRPPVRRFAEGGPVGNATVISSSGAGSAGPGTVNITINAAGGDLSDDRTIRVIADKLTTIMRRTGRNAF